MVKRQKRNCGELNRQRAPWARGHQLRAPREGKVNYPICITLATAAIKKANVPTAAAAAAITDQNVNRSSDLSTNRLHTRTNSNTATASETSAATQKTITGNRLLKSKFTSNPANNCDGTNAATTTGQSASQKPIENWRFRLRNHLSFSSASAHAFFNCIDVCVTNGCGECASFPVHGNWPVTVERASFAPIFP